MSCNIMVEQISEYNNKTGLFDELTMNCQTFTAHLCA